MSVFASQSPPAERRWPWSDFNRGHALVAGIIVLGAAIRFAGLDLQSYDHDESVTASLVLQPSLRDTLDVVVRLERSPPLYYILAWAWSKLVGTGEVGLRSLSALVGACTVPAAYWAAREFGLGRSARFATLALFALSPYLVWYSQEARSYELLVLCEMIALALFARWLRRPGRLTGWAWAGASVLALSSHYFAIFLIAPQALLLLIRHRPRRQLVLPLATIGAAGAALLPLVLAQQGGGRTDNFTNVPLAGRAGTSLLDFFAGEDPPFPTGGDRPLVLLIAGGTIAALVIGWTCFRAIRSRDPATRSACAALGLIAVSAFGLPLLLALGGIDFFKYHNLVGTVPPLLILIAAALAQPAAGRISKAILATVLTFSSAILIAVELDHDLQRPDWRGVAQAIGNAPQNRLVFASSVAGTPLRYYLRHGTEISASARNGCVHVAEVIVITNRPGATTFDHRRYRLTAGRNLVEPFTFFALTPRTACTKPADFAGFVNDSGYALLVPAGGPTPRE